MEEKRLISFTKLKEVCGLSYIKHCKINNKECRVKNCPVWKWLTKATAHWNNLHTRPTVDTPHLNECVNNCNIALSQIIGENARAELTRLKEGR